MNLNKYDISNLFILSFVIIFTIFVFLHEFSENSLKTEYDKFSSLKISDEDNIKYISKNKKINETEIIEESYDELQNIINDLETQKPINTLKDIKIANIKLSYYSPYGKYTPIISDKNIDIKRDIFYIYVEIKDLSLENSFHKFALYTNFYDTKGEIIDSLSQKIGTFEGSNFIFANTRIISIPIILENKNPGEYNYNVYVEDLISNKNFIYEDKFRLIE